MGKQSSAIICPKCGTENAEDAQICVKCRINLEWALDNYDEHQTEFKLNKSQPDKVASFSRRFGPAWRIGLVFSIVLGCCGGFYLGTSLLMEEGQRIGDFIPYDIVGAAVIGAITGGGIVFLLRIIVDFFHKPKETQKIVLRIAGIILFVLFIFVIDDFYDWIRKQIYAGAELQGADFQEANLRGFNLHYTNFQDAVLQSADLREANLAGAKLQRANLKGANMSDAFLNTQDPRKSGCYYINSSTGANLQNADLSGAILKGINMSGANLEGANLEGADLQYACIGNANLVNVNLKDANLTGADFGFSNLTGANLLNANVSYALFDFMTIMPDGNEWSKETDLTKFTIPSD